MNIKERIPSIFKEKLPPVEAQGFIEFFQDVEAKYSEILEVDDFKKASGLLSCLYLKTCNEIKKRSLEDPTVFNHAMNLHKTFYRPTLNLLHLMFVVDANGDKIYSPLLVGEKLKMRNLDDKFKMKNRDRDVLTLIEIGGYKKDELVVYNPSAKEHFTINARNLKRLPLYHEEADYGDILSLEEFKHAIRDGAITPYDGCFSSAIMRGEKCVVANSQFRNKLLPTATHVVWYNK